MWGRGEGEEELRYFSFTITQEEIVQKNQEFKRIENEAKTNKTRTYCKIVDSSGDDTTTTGRRRIWTSNGWRRRFDLGAVLEHNTQNCYWKEERKKKQP